MAVSGRGPSVAPALNATDYEHRAAELLTPDVHAYFAGGSGDERTLRDNRAAWARMRLRPRVLVGVSDTTTATTVLGVAVKLPVLLAPVAFQRLLHPDGEAACARAAARAGTVFCASTMSTLTPAELAYAAPGAARWLALYPFRDPGVTRALIDEALDAGCVAIALTADTPRTGRRERELRHGFALSGDVPVPAVERALGGPATGDTARLSRLLSDSFDWDDLAALAGEVSVPVVVKGILAREDARLACGHGAAGIVVSNHGGRQLDGALATADALADVADAVAGEKVEVLVDGGVTRGSDVAAALALGARAVLIGRPYAWALAAGGEEGVHHLLDLLGEETALALALLGATSPDRVGREHLARAAVAKAT